MENLADMRTVSARRDTVFFNHFLCFCFENVLKSFECQRFSTDEIYTEGFGAGDELCETEK